MRIYWTKRARSDLSKIGAYIAADNPRAARRLLAGLQERARQIAPNPFLGRMVPEFTRGDIRELIEGNYRIVYRVRKKSVDILTVFEGHHLFPDEVLPEQ